MPGAINIGSIEADLQINSGNLERGLAGGRVAMAAFERELAKLFEELQSGNILFADYAARITAVGDAQGRLAAQMRAAYGAAGTANGGLLSTVNATSQMANGFARAGMQFGYMVDDIQYGVSSIVNNVAPLGQSLAAGLGASGAAANAWGAGLQIAAVAAYQLYRHWDDLLKIMDIPTVRTEAEEMEALADKTRRTADETERLNRYKREQHQIQTMMDRRPQEEEKSIKDTIGVIADADSERVLKGVLDTLEGEGRLKKIDPETEVRLKEEEEMTRIAERDYGRDSMIARATRKTMEDDRKEEQDAVDKENLAYAKKIMIDPGKRDTLLALAEKHPTAFPEGFAGNVREVTPESRDRQQEVKDEDKTIDQMSEAAAEEERRQKARDQADKQAEADRKRREREEAADRREAIANAKIDSPTIERSAQRLATGAMTGQISPQEALDRITNTLMDNDQKYIAESEAAKKTADPSDDIRASTEAEKRADVAAQAILKEAGRNIKGKDLGEVPQYEMDHRVTSSQQFSAADLASRVQAGVNNQDDTKKQTEYLNKCQAYLEKLVAKNAENPWAGFQEK